MLLRTDIKQLSYHTENRFEIVFNFKINIVRFKIDMHFKKGQKQNTQAETKAIILRTRAN